MTYLAPKIVFVQDNFVEHLPYGGAELSLQALIDSCPYPFACVRSNEVTEAFIDDHADAYWILGNCVHLSPTLMPRLIRGSRYSIIEFDRKYCLFRSPTVHRELTGTDCACAASCWGELWEHFYAHARTVWWMSERQMNSVLGKLPLARGTKNIVLSSIFAPATLDRIDTLFATYRERKEPHWLIIASSSWLKAPTEAEHYCREHNLLYETVWQIPYDELLVRFARAEGYVFLPRGEDTCPRAVIEAKLLGCKLVLNDYVEHAPEAWFATDSRETIRSYLSLAPLRFWTTTANDIASTATAQRLELSVADQRSEDLRTTTSRRSRTAESWPPRVLVAQRANASRQPGGDSAIAGRLVSVMRDSGYSVDVDTTGTAPLSRYDIVHLFNFALRDELEQLARRCVNAGVPYVVHTMYEDWPRFFAQMVASFRALERYIALDQPAAEWREILAREMPVRPEKIWDNSWTANHAAALIASGDEEARCLRFDYPYAQRVRVCLYGQEFRQTNDGGELFTRATGLSNYVLCVGRLEWRKNQLMLLKALEESPLTLVFATGGFTYQEYYASLCRAFRRKGRTVFLDRLEPELLASAYAGAKAHVLPSWYELPGLVSLEAGSFATNVVATDYGTARDYLGTHAYYCEPGDPESILEAVNAAVAADRCQLLQYRLSHLLWKGFMNGIDNIHREALGSTGQEDSGRTERRKRSGVKAVRSLRVLARMRRDVHCSPGGDFVLMTRLLGGLMGLGVTVEWDFDGTRSPKDFDLVQLCNFCRPDSTELQAREAYHAGTPYVVFPLYEDWPRFFNVMYTVERHLIEYVKCDQLREVWAPLIARALAARPCSRAENGWAAEHSSMLIVSGKEEARALREHYPKVGPIAPMHFGSDALAAAGGPDLFVRETGMKDFVLCVGRLEARKNQLMLLRALEDSDLPVVLVSGGSLYDQAYKDAVVQFRRRGKTVVLNHLSSEMLASAYAAARVHALPSWYELPGLVTLEAARHGKNVVVTEFGTVRDYVGDHGFYCHPGDIESIHRSVVAAYEAPPNGVLQERVSQFTWERSAMTLLAIYCQVLGIRPAEKETIAQHLPT